MQKDTRKQIIVGIIVLVAITALVLVTALSKKKNTTPIADTKQTATSAQVSTTPATTGSKYKNGTFTATGSYDSPGATEDITVSVTLVNDKITDTSAVSGSKDNTSRSYQERFIAGYKQLVVGKDINSVGDLGTVSGSSLTTQGFEQALTKIKQAAKA